MPSRTVKAGVVQKLSNGDYGSFGACYETTITFDFEEIPNAEQLLALSRQMYGDARHAVAEELARQKAEFAAARPKPVETAAQRDERAREPEHAAATNGRTNGYHDGDRAIDEARANRPEPRNGDGASTRPRYDRDPPRDDRGGRRDDRRGGGGGGPNPGKKLLAWARGKDEEGAGGVERYIKEWAKDRGIFGMWQDWDRRDVDDAREAATKWIDGDQR